MDNLQNAGVITWVNLILMNVINKKRITIMNTNEKVELSKEQKEYISEHFKTREYGLSYVFATGLSALGMMYYIELPESLFGPIDYYDDDLQAPIFDYLREIVEQTDGISKVDSMLVDNETLWFILFDEDGNRIREDEKYIRDRMYRTAFDWGRVTKRSTVEGECKHRYEETLWQSVKSLYQSCFIPVSYADLEGIIPYEDWREEFLRGYNYVEEEDDDNLPF